MEACHDANTGQTILPKSPSVETIVHESLHAMFPDGIIQASVNLVKKDEDWKGLSGRDIVSLNEAFTEMFTQELLPELDINSGYSYGSSVLKQYYNLAKKYNQNPSRFLSAYCDGDSYAFSSLAEDLLSYQVHVDFHHDNNLWVDFVKTITTAERANSLGAFGLTGLTKKQVDETLQQVENSYKTSSYHSSFSDFSIINEIKMEQQNRLEQARETLHSQQQIHNETKKM